MKDLKIRRPCGTSLAAKPGLSRPYFLRGIRINRKGAETQRKMPNLHWYRLLRTEILMVRRQSLVKKYSLRLCGQSGIRINRKGAESQRKMPNLHWYRLLRTKISDDR